MIPYHGDVLVRYKMQGSFLIGAASPLYGCNANKTLKMDFLGVEISYTLIIFNLKLYFTSMMPSLFERTSNHTVRGMLQ